MKELLKIDDDSRTVKELANSLRGESVWIQYLVNM
jgi:hypothetical protein